MDQIKQMKGSSKKPNMLSGQISDLNNRRGHSPDLADVVGAQSDLSPIPNQLGSARNYGQEGTASARRRPQTTSAAQLQVYLLPDY